MIGGVTLTHEETSWPGTVCKIMSGRAMVARKGICVKRKLAAGLGTCFALGGAVRQARPTGTPGRHSIAPHRRVGLERA